MNLIVVGTDGSDSAMKAVGKAAELARQTEGKLAIVSAYKPLAGARISGAGDAGSEASAWNESLSESAVDAILRDAAQLAKAEGIEVETHSCKGDPADALLSVAKDHDAELIVVGNKGMTGARRVLGSVPNKVTHHAECSVMVVQTS
jgi:nucleotide-binding universal stress UspA family protein